MEKRFHVGVWLRVRRIRREHLFEHVGPMVPITVWQDCVTKFHSTIAILNMSRVRENLREKIHEK